MLYCMSLKYIINSKSLLVYKAKRWEIKCGSVKSSSTIQFIHPLPHITLRNSFLLIDRDYCEKFTNNKYIIVFWLWNRLMPKAVLNWIRTKKTSEKKRFYYFLCVKFSSSIDSFSACFRSFLCRFYASFTNLLIQLLRPY